MRYITSRFILDRIDEFEHRFIDKIKLVDDANSCWLWTGNKNKGGYGTFLIEKKQATASRVAFIMFNRATIPAKMLVCHACDNRLCVRPEHLFIGTHKINTQDAIRKGRISHGSNHYAAKLTDSIARYVRKHWKFRDRKHSLTAMAKKFGISRGVLQDIKSGKTWKHA